MNVIEILALVFIMSVGHFLGTFLELKLGLGGWFLGCYLGIFISLVLLHIIKVVSSKSKCKEGNLDNKVTVETNIHPWWNLKVTKLKATMAELNLLPADSEETTVWNDRPVHLQIHCEKREDGKFQITLSAKFQEENDTITYMREFIGGQKQT